MKANNISATPAQLKGITVSEKNARISADHAEDAGEDGAGVDAAR